MADHFDGREFAEGQLATDIHPAVDVRGVGLATPYQVMSLLVAEMAIRLADQPVLPGADPSVFQFPRARLLFHQHT